MSHPSSRSQHPTSSRGHTRLNSPTQHHRLHHSASGFFVSLSENTKILETGLHLSGQFTTWKDTQEGCTVDCISVRENRSFPNNKQNYCLQPHSAEESWETCSHGHGCRKGLKESVVDYAAENPNPKENESKNSITTAKPQTGGGARKQKERL